MHFGAPEQAPEAIRAVHATPLVVGRIARDARVGRLLLSHVIEPPIGHATPEVFSATRLDDNVAAVRSLYSGPTEVAVDLRCLSVG
jgi:ribonuclease BN (tRNA processing enzyme)